MIIGIGTDLVEVGRMQEKILSEPFVKAIFSSDEIVYCSNQKFPAQHFAARFAAKEAFLKAAGIGLTKSYDLFDIEIVLLENGKPELKLSGEFLELKKTNSWIEICVSLTHVADMAAAFVVIEK